MVAMMMMMMMTDDNGDVLTLGVAQFPEIYPVVTKTG